MALLLKFNQLCYLNPVFSRSNQRVDSIHSFLYSVNVCLDGSSFAFIKLLDLYKTTQPLRLILLSRFKLSLCSQLSLLQAGLQSLAFNRGEKFIDSFVEPIKFQKYTRRIFLKLSRFEWMKIAIFQVITSS